MCQDRGAPWGGAHLRRGLARAAAGQLTAPMGPSGGPRWVHPGGSRSGVSLEVSAGPAAKGRSVQSGKSSYQIPAGLTDYFSALPRQHPFRVRAPERRLDRPSRLLSRGKGPQDAHIAPGSAPKRLTCIEQAQANGERQHARSAAGRNNPSPRRAGRPERPPRCMDPPRCAGTSMAAQEGRPDTIWWCSAAVWSNCGSTSRSTKGDAWSSTSTPCTTSTTPIFLAFKGLSDASRGPPRIVGLGPGECTMSSL